MKREEYLQRTIEQIRCEKAREGVKRELQNHMDDQKEAFLSEGMTQTEAEESAVKEMGDPVEAGVELDRIHRPKIAWHCILLIGILYFAGLILQYQLGMQTEESRFAPGRSFLDFLGYAGRLLAGFAVMLAVSHVDYSRIAKWVRQMWVLYFGVLFLGMTFFGTQVNGMNFSIYGIVNMKLLVFLFLPLYGGLLFWYRGRGAGGILVLLLWSLLPVMISLFIPSMTTAVLLMVLMLLMLTLVVLRGWYRVSAAKALGVIWGAVFALVSGGIASCFWVWGKSYQIDRIWAFVMPYLTDAKGELEKLRRAIEESHLLGASAWAGKVPDFGDGYSYMMTHVAASYGILAALLIAGMMLALFIYFLRISLRQKNQLGMIMGTGCVLVLLAQTLLYLVINGGWAVYGSIYCPFLTYGGTGMLVTNILLGILLSIYRYENIPLVIPDVRRRILRIH